jgi:glycosyltransferase involved in cell wall biosynthesis
MKVLHIIDSGGLYGAEVMLLNLMEEQIKMGLDPTIASIGEKHIEEKPLETEALKRGFKVKKIRMFPGPNIAGTLKVLRYAQTNGFDLLHSHGYKGNILFGLLPRKLRKIPMVSTLHGWTSTNGFSKMRLYEWLDRKSLKHIDSVVLVSNAMKSHPRLKSLKDINIHVIPNGIPVSKSSPPSQLLNIPSSIPSPSQRPNFSSSKSFDKKIIDFCQNAYTIGSIGRFSTEKGYKYLIEALSLLVKKGIDTRLVIIGEGYERGLLEELVVQLGLKDRILLTGYVEDAKKYIPYFDVYAISSLTEGMPITLLEAMQSKVPVVATIVGGIPDVLGAESGMLVPPCNPAAFARAVSLIAKDKKLAEGLAAHAYKQVINHFSSKDMAQKYSKLYKDSI